jgi:hypothetical protein
MDSTNKGKKTIIFLFKEIIKIFLFKVLNNKELFKTARSWERYEKLFRKRGRLSYEKQVIDF